MKNNNKKGFTLTELVVVIAIIAILLAVLIPMLFTYVDKARVSNDSELVRNLNTALTTDALEKGKHKNMTEALDAAANFGYLVDKINASKTNNEILWDSVNDVFCYYDNGKLVYIPNSTNGKPLDADDYRLWVISDQVNDTWSTYYTGSASNSQLQNLTKGFDSGKVEGITSLKYVGVGSKQDVVIRTNSFDTTLTIDAAKDTVKHYDEVGSLNIIAVANASYHENGQVKFVEISTGRIAIEAGAEVSHIHINAKENVEEGENAFEEVIIAYDQTVDFTDVSLSRDDVEIAAQGTLVVALQAGTETPTEQTAMDYVWLTKQGVYEQIVVSDNADTKENKNSTEVEWVDTSDKSDETKDAAQKIANNIGRDEEGNVSATVEIGETEFNVGFDADRNMTFTQNGTTETSTSVVDGNTTTKTETSSVTVYTVTDNGMVATTTTVTTVTTETVGQEATVVETTSKNQTEYVTEGNTTTATTYNVDENGNKTQVGEATTADATETKLIETVNTEMTNSVEKPADKESTKAGATLFAGGTGSKNDPYLISSTKQWNNFYQKVYDWDGDTIPYFKLANDIDFAGLSIDNFAMNGTKKVYDFLMWFDLDGGDFTLKNIEKLNGFCQLFPYIWYARIHDITIDYNLDETRTAAMVYYPVGENYFTNIKTTGSISTTANWATAYVAYMYKAYSDYPCNVYYTNCVNEANIKGSYGNNGYIAVFGSHNGGGGHVTFDNCSNYGGLLGGYVGFVGMGNDSAYTFVDENAVKNYGSMMATKNSGYFNYNSSAETKTIGGVTCVVKQAGSSIGKSSIHTTDVPENYGDFVVLNAVENASRYEMEISLSIQVYNYDNGANANKWSGGFPRSITLTFDPSQVVDGKINTNIRKAYVGEIEADTYHGYGNTTPTYEGIFLPENFDLFGDDVEIIENQGDLYYVKYNNEYFFIMYSADYPGWYSLLCTNTDGEITTANVTISFSVTAYNPNGSVLSFSKFSYNVNVQEAINFFGGLNN